MTASDLDESAHVLPIADLSDLFRERVERRVARERMECPSREPDSRGLLGMGNDAVEAGLWYWDSRYHQDPGRDEGGCVVVAGESK